MEPTIQDLLSSPVFWVGTVFVGLFLNILGGFIFEFVKRKFGDANKFLKAIKEKERKEIIDEGINLLLNPQRAIEKRIDVLNSRISYLFYLIIILIFLIISPTTSNIWGMIVVSLLASIYSFLIQRIGRTKYEKFLDFYEKNIDTFNEVIKKQNGKI